MEIPKEVPKETPKQVTSEVAKEVHGEGPKEPPAKEVAPKKVSKEIAKEPPKEVPKEVAREIPKEAPNEISTQVTGQFPKEPRKEVAKEVARETPKELPKEVSIVTFHPGERLTMWTKGERVFSSLTSLLAKEGEVRQFFSNYVDRYHRKDVGGFLSLFSSKAIQNQTEGSEAIRSFYTKFFNQSQDLRYQIEAMNIEISQYRVDVKARFRVDQKLKKDGEERVWKGDIRWVLVKEGGSLKISSLDYRNEKLP
jgi:ketosteroid isomerase-like protein